MDRQSFRPEEEQKAGFVVASQDGYDESVLGVECAWPMAEREELPTPS